MSDRKKILAICGSTRARSTNLNLLNAIADLSRDELDIEIYKGLSDLPHFNPDNDIDDVVTVVANFRKKLREADGVIICTPEYAMGLPGTLKNAIDWTVSSCEFSHKPVAAITASTAGQKAHESLLGILTVIEAKMNDNIQLLISFAKTKINENKITDEKTFKLVSNLIATFVSILRSSE